MKQNKKLKLEKNNLLIIGLSIFVLILMLFLISTLFSFDEYKKISENKFNNLQMDFNNLLTEKQDLEQKLNLKVENLKDVEMEKSEIENNLSKLNDSVTDTLDKIDYYKQEIDNSMDWFNKNSYFDESDPLQKDVMRKLKNSAVYYEYEDSNPKNDYNSCTIYTNQNDWIGGNRSLSIVNDRSLQLRYEDDINITTKEDYLQSLSGFLKNKKGDCEDWSLLFVAELRYVYDECKKKSPNVIVGHWLSEENKYNHFYVICGTFEYVMLDDDDPNKYYGHCNVILSPEKIDSVNDINKLLEGVIIEPQTGEFKFENGRMTIDSDGYPTYSNYYFDESGELWIYSKFGEYSGFINDDLFNYYIDTIILENDMLYLSQDYSDWLSYSELKKELEEKEKLLQESLSSDK